MHSIELIAIELCFSLAAAAMDQRGTLSAQHAKHRRHPRPSVAEAEPRPSSWQLTRRLPCSGRLALFRAATANELGPGCYVLKTTRSNDRHDNIGPALLRREATLAADIAHQNLTSV